MKTSPRTDQLAPLARCLPALRSRVRSELLDVARTWVKGRRSPRTRESYREDLVLCGRWLLEDQVASDDAAIARVLRATPPELLAWRDSLAESRRPATVARRLAALRALFGALTAGRYIEHNPLAGVETPTVVQEDQRTPWLEAGEVRMLFLAATTTRRHAPRALRNRAILGLLASCGLRRAEVLGIRPEDIDVPKREIRVRGKRGKVRRLGVSEQLAVDLWQLGGSATSPTSSIFPLSRVRLNQLCRSWARAAGLDPANVTPHALRRSYATAALDRAIPIEILRRSMGHADPRMTARYDRRRQASAFVDYGEAVSDATP